MKAVLLIDIGSTYTKLTAVDIEQECILGTSKAFTTVQTDVNEGLQKALEELCNKTGISEFSEKYACSSAAGGLKMVSVGLVPELTAKASRMASLSAGAKVMKTYSYELNTSEAKEIYDLKPDIILLSGGTNGGNTKTIIHNARMIADINLDFPVIAAGNKSADDEISMIFSKTNKEIIFCENVMPEFNVLNIEPARKLIREIFLKKIIKAKGLTQVQDLIAGILMPTPSAVLNAAHFLSTGCDGEEGIGDLMVVDVGGATTDVYTITDGSPSFSGVFVKGLPEPFDKRTVEGDLGVRYNAQTILDTVGADEIVRMTSLTKEEVIKSIELINKNPDILPTGNNKIEILDRCLAGIAVRLAIDRHAGRIEKVHTLQGEAYIQSGKDLGKVKKIIGTGGPVINCSYPADVLNEAIFKETDLELLKPKKAQFLIDKKYILAAMGLLCDKYPQIAIRIMKKELEMIKCN